MSDVLTFQDISFGYGERKLFEGFSLAIPEGGITAVLGPNGCGKSTLLALTEGMLKPACGAVLLSGTDTLSLSAKERARLLAMLPQVHRTPSMKRSRSWDWKGSETGMPGSFRAGSASARFLP